MPESQETSDYPGALDTWVDVTNKEDLADQTDVNKIKAAIEAIQTEIGTDPAGTLATLKARLAIMMATNGAFAQGTSFPVSPTPVEGQVFYRTDENTPYVYDGSDWIPFVASSSEFFSSSGTFTVPGGVTKVYLTMVGGGGGGGKPASSVYNKAGGGGAGQGLVNFPLTVTPASTITVTIGAGGSGTSTAGGSGSNGGTTSFGSVSVQGGGGGMATSGTGVQDGGGAGGGGREGSKTSPGKKGYKGGTGGGGTNASGGGGSIFADGGTGGNAGTLGSGGGSGTGTSGAGGDGFVLVAW